MKKSIKKLLLITIIISSLTFNYNFASEVTTSTDVTEEENTENEIEDTESITTEEDEPLEENEESTEDTDLEEDIEEDDGSEEAGITPDSPLYVFDKLFEEIQIKMASDDKEQAKLFIKFAKERLAEGKSMEEKELKDLLEATLEDYIELMGSAEEKVSIVILEEEESEDVKDIDNDDILEELEDASEIDEDMIDNIDEELKEKAKDKSDQAYLVANVVKDLDKEQVKNLREEGLGYGQISQVMLLAEYTESPVEEISGLFESEDKGFGEVAKELGVNPSEIRGKGKGKGKGIDKDKSDENEKSDVDVEFDSEEEDIDIRNEAKNKKEEKLKEVEEKKEQKKKEIEERREEKQNEAIGKREEKQKEVKEKREQKAKN